MDSPATQMFKSLVAAHREEHAQIQPSEGVSHPINPSSSAPEREHIMPVEHEPERINVIVRSLSVSSNPEASQHSELSSSHYVIWRNGGSSEGQPEKSHTPRTLRHRPTGLRHTRSYTDGEEPYIQSMLRNDTVHEDMDLITAARRTSSTPLLIGGPSFELVQSEDGLFEVGWEAMPPSIDDPSPPSDTASEVSSPDNVSLEGRTRLRSHLPDSMWAWNDDAPRPQMRTRNDSLTAPDILVHTATSAHPHLQLTDTEEPSSDLEPSTSTSTQFQARPHSPPPIAITQREILPHTANRQTSSPVVPSRDRTSPRFPRAQIPFSDGSSAILLKTRSTSRATETPWR